MKYEHPELSGKATPELSQLKHFYRIRFRVIFLLLHELLYLRAEFLVGTDMKKKAGAEDLDAKPKTVSGGIMAFFAQKPLPPKDNNGQEMKESQGYLDELAIGQVEPVESCKGSCEVLLTAKSIENTQVAPNRTQINTNPPAKVFPLFTTKKAKGEGRVLLQNESDMLRFISGCRSGRSC
jgi:hypothetical protein